MSSRPAWGLLVRGSSPAWLTSGVSWAILPPQVSTADTIRMLSTLGGNMQCKQRAVPGGIHTLHDAMHGAIQGARQCACGVLLHDLEGVGLVTCGTKYKVRARRANMS